MKHKRLKTYLKLGIFLFSISLFIIACQKEDYLDEVNLENIDEYPHYIVQKRIQPHLENNSLLRDKLEAIKTINTQDNSISREVYNKELDFIIDTDIANYIEFGDYHSYTFPVTRTSDNGLVENLVLSLQNDGTYRAFLIAYDLTEEEVEQIRNDIDIDLSDKTTYTVIDDQEWIDSILTRNIADINDQCWDYTYEELKCYYNQHTAAQVDDGESCMWVDEGNIIPEAYGVLTLGDCNDGGPGETNDGPDNTGPDSGNDVGNEDEPGDSTNGGNSNGNTNDNDNDGNQPPNDNEEPDSDCTQTNVDGNCVEDTTLIVLPAVDNNNCVELAKLGNNSLIKQTFNTLEDRVSNENVKKEFGYKYTDNGNPQALEDYVNPNNNVEESNHVKPEYGNGIYGMSHSHPQEFIGTKETTYPMFSIDDLFQLAPLAILHSGPNAQDYSKIFFSLTAMGPNGPETYALKINNFQTFLNFANSYFSNQKIKKDLNKYLNKVYDEILKDWDETATTQYLKAFFKYTSENNIGGFDIYKATDVTFNNWTKITYTPPSLGNNGTLTETDCNN